MRAGKLDRRITIQKPVRVQDASGQMVDTWEDFATVWAEFRPLAGNERFLAQQVMAELDAQFRIRYLRGVTPLYRILYEGNEYEITAVLTPDRNREMHLLVKAHVPAIEGV